MNQDNKNEEKNSCQQEPETAEDAVKAPETENEEHMENQAAQDAGNGEGAEETAGDHTSQSGSKKDSKDVQIEELQDRLKRQMAEFDNFRKRTEKEKASMYQIGAREVIEKILPVVDNFERGLATVPQEDATNPYAEGMEKIYKQLMTVLDDLGVKSIEAVGQEFNPDFHNAVMHVEDEEAGENVIVEEFQKGYLYKDQVVRHSMVKVAN